MDLHCFLMSHKKDARLMWVKVCTWQLPVQSNPHIICIVLFQICIVFFFFFFLQYSQHLLRGTKTISMYFLNIVTLHGSFMYKQRDFSNPLAICFAVRFLYIRNDTFCFWMQVSQNIPSTLYILEKNIIILYI